MITGISQTIATLLVTLIFYTQDIFFISCYEKKRKAGGGCRSSRYSISAGIIITCLSVQPILLPWLALDLPDQVGLLIQMVGAVLITTGLLLQIWARKHLRQFYAERVELQRLHWLVNTGPYALMRHPIFMSYFLLAAGLLLINPGLITLLVLIFFLWYFVKTARKEEILLSRKLPGYNEYMRHTHMFFPGFNRVKGNQSLEPRQ